jgi:taurine dioxygenase
MEVLPVSGHTGAEIRGVDLSGPLSKEAVAGIRGALLRWKVVFFRDQRITRAQHVAFGRCFGEVTPAHPILPAADPANPEILVLDGSTAIREEGPLIERRWHTDVTFTVNPPMGAILRGVLVPPYGGDTQWTNLAVAYQRLSAPIRDLIDGLHAVHENNLPVTRGEETSPVGERFAATVLRSVHPVVRVHPETGERILFVNPLFTAYIVELARRESRHLLEMLYEHLSTPEFTGRFRWDEGSIAFWDNRATAHIVPSDVPAEYKRSVERITLAGDVPVGVDGQPSRTLAGKRAA